MTKALTVYLSADTCSYDDCPLDWGGWKFDRVEIGHYGELRIYPHDSRHHDPYYPIDYGETSRDINVTCIGLQSKLRSGTAFLLCRAGRHGVAPYGAHYSDVDTRSLAGVLHMHDHIVKATRKLPAEDRYKVREVYAKAICETYSAWREGEVYVARIDEDDAERLDLPHDSLGGIYLLDNDHEAVIRDCMEIPSNVKINLVWK